MIAHAIKCTSCGRYDRAGMDMTHCDICSEPVCRVCASLAMSTEEVSPECRVSTFVSLCNACLPALLIDRMKRNAD